MKTPNAKALRKAKKTEELRGGRPPPPKAHEQAARAMTPHELERIKTQQAYEIFSLLDVDGSGRVSDREMERFIAGDTRHTFKRTFPDPDIGVFWATTIRKEVMITTSSRLARRRERGHDPTVLTR